MHHSKVPDISRRISLWGLGSALFLAVSFVLLTLYIAYLRHEVSSVVGQCASILGGIALSFSAVSGSFNRKSLYFESWFSSVIGCVVLFAASVEPKELLAFMYALNGGIFLIGSLILAIVGHRRTLRNDIAIQPGDVERSEYAA
jgi:hypothetical protein